MAKNDDKKKNSDKNAAPGDDDKLTKSRYEDELERMQFELVHMVEWIRVNERRVVVVFEGRDAAGKGGTISRIVAPLNPRYTKVVALPKPTERESTQWYFQRYVQHLPAAGELVIFDRSWYNRAGVERVMGFCTEEQYWDFLRATPEFERMLVRSGIQLIKYWMTVSPEEQLARFRDRLQDPAKRWKFSPIDVESQRKWNEYSLAKDVMFEHTSIPEAPWWEVDSNDKRQARLNTMHHLLSQIPYEPIEYPEIKLVPAEPGGGLDRPPSTRRNLVPQVY